MPDRAGTAERLAIELARVLRPIAGRLSDEGVLDTFEELGVRFPDGFRTDPTVAAARSTILNVTGELDGLIEELFDAIDAGDPGGISAAGLALVAQVGRVFEAFGELIGAVQAVGPTLPGITPEQVAELVTDLPAKLTGLLLAAVLERAPVAGAVLAVFGIVERSLHEGVEGDPSRPPHERVSVRLDRLIPAVTDPVRHLSDLYGWGAASFDAERLLGVLEMTVGRLGLPVLFMPGEGVDPPRLQVFALDLEPTPDGAGLRLDLVLPAALAVTFPFEVSPPTWIADVAVSGDLRAGATGELRPPFDLTVTPPSGSFAGNVTVGLHAHPAEPFVVLGQAGGSRLEFERLDLTGGLALAGGIARGEPVAEGEVTGGRLVIDASSGDGFLRTILAGSRLESRFDVGFSFTPAAGLRFHGSGGLQVQLPVHVALGPIELQALYLVAGLASDTVPLELSAAFRTRLGPVQASVDRLGMRVELGFPPGGGNLGPVALGFGFKPPTGVGLAVDLPVLAGGGFLDLDPDRGEYAGGLELRLLDFVTVTAVGLITTRMPDGSSGFSLLVILTAEFPGSGLQLGFGFTLLGVGGLVGLNRTMRIQALIDGVRTGAIESVMFPRDIAANAPRILSDLRAFFPPRPGTFLVGPMAKLGWGTPTLVTVSVGVFIEIPGNLAVVGVLKVALPDPAAPLLLLQVHFVGAVEPDTRRLFFTAALFDSRVLTTTIGGEMGLLVAWGGDPNFLVTVGGFHPSFRPPPLPFPSPRRISFDILNQPGSRITVSGYFAVTSNTVQFGAQAELLLGFDSFGISGHVSFDALFQFSPFAFEIEISASVSLKAFGVGVFTVDLRFTLSGPSPWRARGRGSISLLFFSISADFDITWGEDRDTTLPPVAVLPLIASELGKLAGWQTVAPTGGRPMVSLRPAAGPDELVLHPLGTLFVRQRAVPLQLRLDRIGGQRPADVNRLKVSVSGAGLVKRSDPAELFALAQFQDMDDAAKLSRPAFEPQPGGVELAADGVAMASRRAVRRSARYEQVIIDTAHRRRARRFTDYLASLFTHFMHGNAISRSPVSQAQARLRQPFEDTIRVTGDGFAVASTRDNTAAATFTSQAAARDHLAEQLATDPALAGTLHVIPTAEVRA
jgi:hypothetical protein